MFTKSRLIYVSHFLSAWGDRMWSFAVAIFLMDLVSENLRLPAIYGLTVSGSVLLFAPLVGEWIDRTPRLRAAQLSLIVQNSTVAICAIILLVQKLAVVEGLGFLLFVKIGAILLGTIARLASVSSSIIIQKDWIVVIAGGNSELLSQLNSTLRRIDLVTKLLAPFVCGQVITLVSLTFGCGFVAGWNLVSMCFEYILLKIVYNRTPDLALKSKTTISKKEDDSAVENLMNKDNTDTDKEITDDDDAAKSDTQSLKDEEESSELENNEESPSGEDDSKSSILSKMFSFLLIIPKGWRQYMSQSVALVGIGLSCLYMTVLGLDAITIAYTYNQCFSELLVGIMIGVSALTGITATFIFTPLSSKIGIIKAGLLFSLAQVSMLVPCVISVFAPGSPFFILPQNSMPVLPSTEPTLTTANFTVFDNSSITYKSSNTTQSSVTDGVFLKCIEGVNPPPSYISLTLLTTGIVLARIGLWGFDLTSTQLFQEKVPEEERGVVGGVQSSMNSLMDILHFILVIFLPYPNQFGILVILSAIFVASGHFLYALYARRELKK